MQNATSNTQQLRQPRPGTPVVDGRPKNDRHLVLRKSQSGFVTLTKTTLNTMQRGLCNNVLHNKHSRFSYAGKNADELTVHIFLKVSG
jgi:hypothetical protein